MVSNRFSQPNSGAITLEKSSLRATYDIGII